VKGAVCQRGDLLRALATGDDAATDFIAQQLMLERVKPSVPDAQDGNSNAPSSEADSGGEAMPSPSLPSPPLQAFPAIPFWQLTQSESYDDDESRLPVTPSQQPAPYQRQPEPEPPALVNWSNLLPRLHRGVGVYASAGQVDVDKLLDKISKGIELEALPRQGRRGWGSAVQLIVDRRSLMFPYLFDQARLYAELTRLYPDAMLSIAEYRGHSDQLLLAGCGRDRQWSLPAPDTLVIACSDMGLLSAEPETRNFWLRLGEQLHNHHCRTVALLPSAMDGDDELMKRYWSLIPWARPGKQPMDADAQLQLLQVLLSPAVRVDMGLLRDVRRLIGADASMETRFLCSSALTSRATTGARFDPEVAKTLRLQFDQQDEGLRRSVLHCLRHWRRHLPPEMGDEEMLSLSTASQALLPDAEELIQAKRRLLHLAEKIGRGETILGVAGWFRALCQRIPEQLWLDPDLKPALQQLWQMAHAYEPDATPPPDYDPRHAVADADAVVHRWQLYHAPDALLLVRGDLPSSGSDQGSWLGEIRSCSGEFVLHAGDGIAPVRLVAEQGRGSLHWPQVERFELRSDRGRLLLQRQAQPSWASAMGRDSYGLWAEFTLEHKGKKVRQRLRWIPPGDFLMGSPASEAERWDDEGPQHAVTLTAGFWLFDTAVSQALWCAVMEGNPSRFEGDALPVDSVSWHGAKDFIKKLNRMVDDLQLSLPSEAQWEYACRAGSNTPFHFGDQITTEQANYDGNYPYAGGEKGQYRETTVAVTSFTPNDWGMWQMHGNVGEWCRDGQRKYQEGRVVNTLGQEGGADRVLRGGGWYDYGARFVRAAGRFAGDLDYRNYNVGFRCCARVQEQQGAEPGSDQGSAAERPPTGSLHGGAGTKYGK